MAPGTSTFAEVMSQSTDFFAEFPPVSKKQWLDRIAKDLKGKPLEELHWQLAESLRIDPFAHVEDQPVGAAPLVPAEPGWEINEDIEPETPETANRQALEALAFGAESLYFQPGASAALPQLLDRVHLDFISLHFGGKGLSDGPAALLFALGTMAKDQGLNPTALRGSLYYDPAAAAVPDWRYAIDLLQYAQAEFPEFRCLSVDGSTAFQGTARVVDELATLLQRGSDYLEQLTARGLSADAVANQMQFSLHIGPSYFVEIAKLRAFKLLWLNMLKAWGGVPEYPILDVRFSPSTYTDDLYTNMIRATTMAMSAVLGGANRLTVQPYDAGRTAQAQYPQTFSRRIARNVQHLLKLESGFGALTDPAAGSFYIEKLTRQLAEAAWEKVKQ